MSQPGFNFPAVMGQQMSPEQQAQMAAYMQQQMQQQMQQMQQTQQQMQQMRLQEQQPNHPLGIGQGPQAGAVQGAQGTAAPGTQHNPAAVASPYPTQTVTTTTGTITAEGLPAPPQVLVNQTGNVGNIGPVTSSQPSPAIAGPAPGSVVAVAPTGVAPTGVAQNAVLAAAQGMVAKMATPNANPNFASTRKVLKPPEQDSTIVFSISYSPNELDQLSAKTNGYYVARLRGMDKADEHFGGKLRKLGRAFSIGTGKREGHLVKSIDIPCVSSEFPFALGATVAVATKNAKGEWDTVDLVNKPKHDQMLRAHGEILFPGNTKRFAVGKNVIYENTIVKEGRSNNFWHIYTNKNSLDSVDANGMPDGITVVNPRSPAELQFCGVPLESPICEFIWNGWKHYGMRLENRQIIHDTLPVPKCVVDDAIKLVKLITNKIPQHDLTKLVVKFNRIGQKTFASPLKDIKTLGHIADPATAERLEKEYHAYNRQVEQKNAKTYSANVAVRVQFTALDDHNRAPDAADPKALTETVDMPTTALLIERQRDLAAHNYNAFERKMAEQAAAGRNMLAAGQQAYLPQMQLAPARA